MKVAVSIPDEVFSEAEALAKQLKSSRSELYSRALSEFVRRHAPERVTQLMTEVVTAVGEEAADPFTKRAARRVMRRVDW
jgi:metal-responsive CopG/Arc/MetJ family transcriptional regulator